MKWNEYGEWLVPHEKWLSGLNDGTLKMNLPANRVIDAANGRFVGALVPGDGLVDELARLPLHPQPAMQVVEASKVLTQLKPALQALQLTSSIGALASVANLGVSCAGFALVLNRLSKIDGKLDDMLGKLDVLQQSVEQLHIKSDALSFARIRSAADSLDRSMAAEQESVQQDLARRARDLFQESRHYYLGLWNKTQPWTSARIPVRTALEMESRFVACGIGEIQAEFVLGDKGSIRHAIKSVASDLTKHFALDAPAALRARSDAAARSEGDEYAGFIVSMTTVSAEFALAAGAANHNSMRVSQFDQDVDMLEDLRLTPRQLVQVTRAADGPHLFLLRSQAA